jgi:hypothetical protein
MPVDSNCPPLCSLAPPSTSSHLHPPPPPCIGNGYCFRHFDPGLQCHGPPSHGGPCRLLGRCICVVFSTTTCCSSASEEEKLYAGLELGEWLPVGLHWKDQVGACTVQTRCSILRCLEVTLAFTYRAPGPDGFDSDSKLGGKQGRGTKSGSLRVLLPLLQGEHDFQSLDWSQVWIPNPTRTFTVSGVAVVPWPAKYGPGTSSVFPYECTYECTPGLNIL